MDNEVVIAIDHGWSHIKTENEVFVTGVRRIATLPPFMDNIVEYRDHFYQVGGKRLEVKDTKVEDDDFYILTLAAVAKELVRKGRRKANVHIVAGLPLNMFGAQKPDFIKYLSRNREVDFRFEGNAYHITISKVTVYPQCYAAITDKIGTLGRNVLVVDIGSWTIDTMEIVNQVPGICYTEDEGLIKVMRKINDDCISVLGKRISETDIEEVMTKGSSDIPKEYQAIIVQGLKDYTSKVLHILKEYGFNLDTMPVIFIGGGATVVQKFMNKPRKNFQFITDVRANAKGFLKLVQMKQKSSVKEE